MVEVVEAQVGELWIDHFDRSVFDTLHADFLPMPNPNNEAKLRRHIRQALIPNVVGPGKDGRVPVVFNEPEDVYNRFLLPGIRIHRLEDIENDDQRRYPKEGTRKYRVPSNCGDRVDVELPRGGGTVSGYTHYVERMLAEPVFIRYDIEIRARYEPEAQCLLRYVNRNIRNRSALVVMDSTECPNYFNVWRDSYARDVSEVIDSLKRFRGYIVSLKVEAELDDYDETQVQAITNPLTLRNQQIDTE